MNQADLRHNYRVMPRFLDTPAGRMFCVHHEPHPGLRTRGHVLCVPAFNEEMNRCRSMVTLLAAGLAQIGIGTCMIDLHGTGDSAGNYVDARWQRWIDDIGVGISYLAACPGGVAAVLGIRLGAMLAADAVRSIHSAPAKLVLWQPVADGRQHFTQFLRLRLAAAMDRADRPKESTAELRAVLAAGTPIEVAGYEIHPELAAQMDRMRLKDLTPVPGAEVLWLEKGAATDAAEVAPVSAGVVEAWRQAGVGVRTDRFEGPEFWQLHERCTAEQAVQKTVEWMHTACSTQ